MSKELKDLEAASEALWQEIATLIDRKRVVDTQVALIACPFKSGDRIVTPTGLGKKGLVVQEVYSPARPRDNDRWVMKCFSINKDGSVGNRLVNIAEWETEVSPPQLLVTN